MNRARVSSGQMSILIGLGTWLNDPAVSDRLADLRLVSSACMGGHGGGDQRDGGDTVGAISTGFARCTSSSNCSMSK